MNKAESYLRTKYSKYFWPYFGLNETIYYSGCTKADLNELFRLNMVKKASGVNGVMIEIVNWKENWVK